MTHRKMDVAIKEIEAEIVDKLSMSSRWWHWSFWKPECGYLPLTVIWWSLGGRYAAFPTLCIFSQHCRSSPPKLLLICTIFRERKLAIPCKSPNPTLQNNSWDNPRAVSKSSPFPEFSWRYCMSWSRSSPMLSTTVPCSKTTQELKRFQMMVGSILRFINFAAFFNLCERKNSHARDDGPLHFRTSEL